MSEEKLMKDIPIKKDNKGNLYFRANEVENIINEKEQEIERLNNIIKTYSGYLDTIEYNMKIGNKMVEYELARAVLTNAKKKFEELKGSDKE